MCLKTYMSRLPPRGSWLRSRLKGQGMESRRPEAANSLYSPSHPFGVFPRESLPDYRLCLLSHVHFVS